MNENEQECRVCHSGPAEAIFRNSEMCKKCAGILSFLEVKHWLGEDVERIPGGWDGEE